MGASYSEQTDPLCLDDDTAAALLRGAPWRRVAIIGDSTAEGVGEPTPGYRTLPWTERLLSALRTAVGPVDYLNTGRTGATTREVIDEQLAAVLAFRPDLVLAGCGGNDLLVRRPDYPATERNLDEILRAATGSGARVLTSTLDDDVRDPAMAAFRPRLEALNDIIRRVARRHGAIVLDLKGHPIRERTDLISADGIHYSMAGHALVAAEVIRTLSAAIPR
ncbi:SGNH/GDSL hydrolase family protein [Nocardia sp. NPDC004068]|uniref:SGNH/GDSL hydrolase family protein n=1 Tax=Nocardia sp. NPDC004068 TaxID=3364303 RepID=UPI0036C75883